MQHTHGHKDFNKYSVFGTMCLGRQKYKKIEAETHGHLENHREPIFVGKRHHQLSKNRKKFLGLKIVQDITKSIDRLESQNEK